MLMQDAIRKSDEQSHYITERALAEVVQKLTVVNKFVKEETSRLKVHRFLYKWITKWLNL